MELELYNDTYKRFCELLPKPDASVLEIGCGPGNITRYVLSHQPALRILATDISENMVRLAKKNNPGIQVQILDCRNLLSIGRKFDGIICGFTIPYLSETDCLQLISDCNSLLDEDGILYISFVPGDHKESGFMSGGTGDRTYFYYHDMDSIQLGLESNHLTIVDIFQKEYVRSDTTTEKHAIIIAKKQRPLTT